MPDLEVLLAVQEHHGVEVGHELRHVVGCFGGERGDDAECGEDLEVVGAFEDEGELGALGAHAEVVEDGVALRVGELGAGGFGLLGCFDLGEDGFVFLCGWLGGFLWHRNVRQRTQ